ncbi:hypothetical protein OCV99_05925 [Dorea acetigenes]|uniref:Uncharacterized protein n=1 Tax=Dorea acetigenes TaxID=2981787 RepID=A0ABT2RL53_9FIRM|nr:hypothetical protein [Dorea acetigenes]MCU6686098.1 hypothetical protein [Dorea acetigenes]
MAKVTILSNITSIHRITIDRATEKKDKWRSEEKSVNDVLNDKNGVLI